MFLDQPVDKPQLNWSVEAASVASIVRFVVPVERHVQQGFVVLADLDRYVDVRVVAVINSSEEVVAMEVARVRPELQMVVAELESSEAEHHRL